MWICVQSEFIMNENFEVNFFLVLFGLLSCLKPICFVASVKYLFDQCEFRNGIFEETMKQSKSLPTISAGGFARKIFNR